MTIGATPSSATAHGAPPAAPDPLDYAATEYQSLDPRVVRLWQLTDLIAYVVLLLIAVVVGVVLMVQWPTSRLWVIGVWLAFALLGAWTILYYHPRNYRAWGYRLDQRVLLIRNGVWFRTIKLLPLPRLQHVDIKRGPLQRHFGLATLVLHTAGTAAASIEVPGLDANDAVRLRDQLITAGGDDGV
jgi:membrane protein YdbS with pleckstrin-like domain